MRRRGSQVYPIDHAANRHAPKVKVFTLDVANSEQVALLETMLRHCKPCHIHLGLPCGTCSRAREKPMPLKFGGHMGPPPLRDADHLLGLPNLKEVDQLKVDLANKLYKCAVRILEVCTALGCMLSIENPARSWLWPLLALLVKATHNADFINWFSDLESVYFDACAHGSAGTRGPNYLQHVVYLQHWRPAAPKTMLMLHGSLTKLSRELRFPLQQRQNIRPCYAIEWPIACFKWPRPWG